MIEQDTKIVLLSLPDEIIDKVLSYLTYHEVSEFRVVCQKLNHHSQHHLNLGFYRMEKFHNSIQKDVKSQLPRRESERRNHPLARHIDILSAIETRLSLLTMTYNKYIDAGLCCFIPGKVLDELWNILRILHMNYGTPPRAHEFLQELRDISSMAMEHFEENIVPSLRRKMPTTVSISFEMPDTPDNHVDCELSTSAPDSSLPSALSVPSDTAYYMLRMQRYMTKIQRQMHSQTMLIQASGREMAELKKQMSELKKQTSEKLSDHGRIVANQNNRLIKQERKINEQNQRILQFEQKISDICSECNHVKARAQAAKKMSTLLLSVPSTSQENVLDDNDDYNDDESTTCNKNSIYKGFKATSLKNISGSFNRKRKCIKNSQNKSKKLAEVKTLNSGKHGSRDYDKDESIEPKMKYKKSKYSVSRD